jgi:selenide,water dikinase
VLREIGVERDARLLVGPDTYDDAAVVVLGEREGCAPGSRVALVQTVDFFPPVVDDPWLYGAIAAANSLSDVYAMGGRPLSALNIAGFPRDFPREWLIEILRGGTAKVRESGALLAGGHTVESAVQFGYAVTGIVDPARVAANSAARPGDRVYLTKPLGMGVMTTSAKLGKISWETLKPAAEQMATLNARAADAMNAAGAHAATDVTGFGLVGHAANVCRASGVTLAVETARVPLFPGALELARRGHFSGGAKRGRAALGAEVAIGAGVDEALAGLCFDAETSGGLLVFVPEERAALLERELVARELPVAPLGVCRPRGAKLIELR